MILCILGYITYIQHGTKNLGAYCAVHTMAECKPLFKSKNARSPIQGTT